MVLDTGFLELFLGLAHRGDLRMGVDHVGNRVVVDMTITGGDVLDTGHPFVLRLVRQHGPGNHIADGVDPFGRGAEMLVDTEEPASIGLQAHRFETQVLGVGPATDTDQHPITGDRLPALGLHPRSRLLLAARR